MVPYGTRTMSRVSYKLLFIALPDASPASGVDCCVASPVAGVVRNRGYRDRWPFPGCAERSARRGDGRWAGKARIMPFDSMASQACLMLAGHEMVAVMLSDTLEGN